MAIKVKTNKASEGWHFSRIEDVYPEYDVATKHGLKDYVWFVFVLRDGTQLKQRYGLTYHKNGFLYPVVKGLLEAEPHEDTDLERFIGMDCEIEVTHNPDATGRIWVNVVRTRNIQNDWSQGEF